MTAHLIQPRESFGPPERQAELRECWRINDLLFDKITAMSGQPTFAELFDACKPDHVNVIANADIYFTDIPPAPMVNEAWALSRWDVDSQGRATLWDHADSQDAWIFNGKPTGIDAPFRMGVPGCDNALAWLIEQAGYLLFNPSKTVRAFHLHNVKWRSYLVNPDGAARGGDKIERVPPPYKLVRPTTL